MRRLWTVCLLSSTLGAAFAQGTLYHHGRIFTADSTDHFANYFVIENGIITEVGDDLSPARLASFAQQVDLGGATVIL